MFELDDKESKYANFIVHIFAYFDLLAHKCIFRHFSHIYPHILEIYPHISNFFAYFDLFRIFWHFFIKSKYFNLKKKFQLKFFFLISIKKLILNISSLKKKRKYFNSGKHKKIAKNNCPATSCKSKEIYAHYLFIYI